MATSNYEFFRKKKGLTQEGVARLLSIDKSTVSKWESGASSPLADRLLDLAKLYDCTVDDLLRKQDTD